MIPKSSSTSYTAFARNTQIMKISKIDASNFCRHFTL